MASEWLSPGVIFGSIGAITGAASLIYTRRVDRRQRVVERPAVNIDLRRSQWPDWLDLEVRVGNRTGEYWVVQDVTVASPKKVRIQSALKLVQDDGAGGDFPIEPTETNTVYGPINVEALYRESYLGLGIAPGDGRTFHFSVSRPPSSRMRIRVRLRSLEADTRPITLKAYRSVPI